MKSLQFAKTLTLKPIDKTAKKTFKILKKGDLNGKQSLELQFKANWTCTQPRDTHMILN